jgi:hypothetical protein
MFDLLKKALLVSRPIFWLIAPAAYLFGVHAGGTPLGPLVFIQAFLLSIPLGIYVFGINDLFDLETDRINPRRKRPQLDMLFINSGDTGRPAFRNRLIQPGAHNHDRRVPPIPLPLFGAPI